MARVLATATAAKEAAIAYPTRRTARVGLTGAGAAAGAVVMLGWPRRIFIAPGCARRAAIWWIRVRAASASNGAGCPGAPMGAKCL